MKTYKLTAIITHIVEAENEDDAYEQFYELESNNMNDLYPKIEVLEEYDEE